MKYSECKILALAILKDANDDVLCQDSSNPDHVIYKDTPESERLKANALSFFFSRESEPDAQFWCDVAGQPLRRFRHKYKNIDR